MPVLDVPGYRIDQEIHETEHSRIYRARRLVDSRSVILKTLKEEYPPLDEVVKYKREYEIACSLQTLPSVGKMLALEKAGHRLVLVLEDFQGTSLMKLLKKNGAFQLVEALSLGLRMAGCLGDIHAARVVHKDVNPNNFLLNPSTDELKIIDFGLASLFPKESPTALKPGSMEGTLAYIAPEQTGRLNHSVDYRSDYYSLGATLYHLLTGKLPFESSDFQQLIHSHLAVNPVPPHLRGKGIPPIVSEIVLKLMAKDPHDRYQSARGLQVDLAECLDWVYKSGTAPAFAIGASDHPAELCIPEKLYGREGEITTLLDGFQRGAL